MSLEVFVRLWRPLFIVAAGLALLAVILGVLSDSGWPAWIFTLAVLLALFGVASLVTHLALRARAAVEDVLDGDDDDNVPTGPTGPKIEPR